MPKIHTENILVSVHTMITKKSIKKILNENHLEEITLLLEDYIKGLALDLNGVAVEVELVDNNSD